MPITTNVDNSSTTSLGSGSGSEKTDRSQHDSSSVSSESDVNMTAWTEPVAIVGYSFRLPQDCTDTDGYWKTLCEKRCTVTQWPEDRLNIKAFYHPDNARIDCSPTANASFTTEDVAAFDAPFFSFSATEAESMDPQQRILLETTYRALENAGMPMEKIYGTRTSVHTGCFSDDYRLIITKDLEDLPKQAATGISLSILANRISWFYGLEGSSYNVDTACSSSLMALDAACNGLVNGSVDNAVVAGSNILLGIEGNLILSNMQFLSPDGRCYSFDHRANGYGRGEGFGAVILKRLSDAVAQNDTIRAVIRSTGSNQDGHSQGLTNPSQAAQMTLIRDTYRKNNLDLGLTRYFEAHGTGTMTGDLTETAAVGNVFRSFNTVEKPLYIGSVKSNLGHLEGASGMASLFKAIIMLERGCILPNADFQELNPSIDTEYLRLKIATEITPWPTDGVRRISVNSFGFGGANAHVVLDDAYSYLNLKGIKGNHLCARTPQTDLTVERPIPASSRTKDIPLRIFTLSSADESGVSRLVKKYVEHFSKMPAIDNEAAYMESLAYTLCNRRSRLSWKATFLAQSIQDLVNIESSVSRPLREAKARGIAYVFTGQGAQYARMGAELLQYDVFQRFLTDAGQILNGLGAKWWLIDEILKGKDSSQINRPEFSQSICTALQIALIELLKHFGVKYEAVVGHSSGEIAAAYAIGALSMSSALKIAYFRGKLASKLALQTAPKWGMLAVGLGSSEITPYMDAVTSMTETAKQTTTKSSNLMIACVNSPKSVTISGSTDLLDLLKDALTKDNIFARSLAVDVGYHSSQMSLIAEEYLQSLGTLEKGQAVTGAPQMISSVTGSRISPDLLANASYWVRNLVSPVQFDAAIRSLVKSTPKTTKKKLDLSHKTSKVVYDLVEIGAHSALQGPIRDILAQEPRRNGLSYFSMLKRGESGVTTTLNLVGKLYCKGYPVALATANHQSSRNKERQHQKMLCDLPEYPFDHSKTYWFESRLSRDWRFRSFPRLDLLGTRSADWNPSDARWRKITKQQDTSWLWEHIINGAVVYPGAGLLVMVVEALRQLADLQRVTVGYLFEEASFNSAVRVPEEGIESTLHITRIRLDTASDYDRYSFRLHFRYGQDWVECAKGTAAIEYERPVRPVDNDREKTLRTEAFKQRYASASSSPTARRVEKDKLYEVINTVGWNLGPSFQGMANIFYTEENTAIADITPWSWSEHELQTHIPLIHPTTLDAVAQSFMIILTKGATFVPDTKIPTRVSNLWLSAKLGQLPLQPVLKACTSIRPVTDRIMIANIFAFDQHTEELLISWDAMEATSVASNKFLYNQSQRCYELSWQPDVQFCTQEQLERACLGTQSLVGSGTSQFPSILLDKTLPSTTSLTPKDTLTVPAFNHPEVVRYIELALVRHQAIQLLEFGNAESGVDSDLIHCMHVAKNAVQNMGVNWQNLRYTYAHPSEEHLQNVVAQHSHEGVTFDTTTLSIGQDELPSELSQKQFDVIMVQDTTDIEIAASFFRTMLKDGGSLIVRRSPQALEAAAKVDDHSLDVKDSPITTWKNITAGSNMWNTHFHLGSSCEILVAGEAPIKPTAEKIDLTIISENPDLAKMLQQDLDETTGAKSRIIGFNDCDVHNGNERHFILLDEPDSSVVSNMNQTRLSWLKDIITSASSFLWVSVKNQKTINPNTGTIDGLTRTLRNENQGLQLTTLVLQGNEDIRETTHQICRVWQSNQQKSSTDYETEIREIDGFLCSGRIIESRTATSDVASQVTRESSKTIQLKDSPPLALSIGEIGSLETLQYKEYDPYAAELASDEVEIEIRAIGLNFMDLLTVLGRVNQKEIGIECAGIVKRVGNDCRDLHPGDHVACIALDCFKTTAVVNSKLCLPMPRGMTFTNAASMGLGFVTSHHGLVELARLQKDESVLITAATGGTGQAAIQIAQHIGADIYVTVGSEAKKQMLMERYKIPDSHIFYSRDLSFVQGIKRILPNGVDVVFNSLSGEKLTAIWSCIAPFGRFVEIGKRDIHTHQALPMFHFARNVSFFAVDIAGMTKERPLMIQRALERSLYNRAYSAPEPVHVFPIARTEDAFRSMQAGNHIGKVCIELKEEDTVKALVKTNSTLRFDSNATYIIAGGLGGLGRSIARWLVERGARNLVLLSRRGLQSTTALASDLGHSDVRILAPPCDISDKTALTSTLAEVNRTMPPIKGCFQSTMVLRDVLFENMSLEDWQVSTRCKIEGSWNLHELLGQNLDFFLLLSSISGVFGNVGQSNYAAGNAFLDALAEYRTSLGLKAVSLDLGWMQDEGVVAESKDLEAKFGTAGFLKPVTRAEFHGLLERYCNPSYEPQRDGHQVVIGLDTPSGISAKGKDVPSFMEQPMFSALWQMDTVAGMGNATKDGAGPTFTDAFRRSKTLADGANVVSEALNAKLSRALGLADDEIDGQNTLQKYGVDSLLGVELRSWLSKEWDVNMPLFDIMGSPSIAALAMTIAGKSSLKDFSST